MPKRLTPEEKQRREEEKRLKAQEAEKKRKEREERKKLKEKDLRDWESLYYYVRDNVMGYDKDQALPKTMVLRLKGLLTNKFMENYNTKSTANYSYETILNTFKYCYSDIQRALRTNSWVDEQHKFNYILKIVESNINNVYMREKNAKKAKEEAKNVPLETTTYVGAEYKPKEKKKDKFSDLW